MGIFKLNGIDYMGGGGGGNANEQVLTWAEYCALTEEEKANGTTYYITDINGEGKDGFQPVIYSTEEREVGVWTDGKPLYEKTLVITSPASSGATGTIDISSLSVEVCLIADGYFQLNDGLSQIAVNEDGRSWCHYYNDNIYYVVQYTTTKMVVRIRYTKTTDQPGSGIWTPQGVPAVHYSTDEQVVGTWIDGKTVYEQTIIGNAISDTGINVLWERTDIDTIIEYNCIFLDDSNLEYNANYYYSTGAYFRVFVDTQSIWTNTKGIVCQRSNNQPINGTRLTVRYTKTT